MPQFIDTLVGIGVMAFLAAVFYTGVRLLAPTRK
jgi:hypothetical protein